MSTSSPEEVLANLAAIVSEVTGVEADEVRMEKSLATDLGVDSLSMVEIVVAIEERLGVVVPDGEVKDLAAVADVVTIIRRLSA
jgi:acyl carrier protein